MESSRSGNRFHTTKRKEPRGGWLRGKCLGRDVCTMFIYDNSITSSLKRQRKKDIAKQHITILHIMGEKEIGYIIVVDD